MRTRAAVIALALLAAVGGAACGEADGGAGASEGRPRIVTALYPLTFLAERIGGDRVEVTDLTPAGAEPHDLELTASQVGALADADLVVYVDAGFQPAVSDAVADHGPERALDVHAGIDAVVSEHGLEDDEHGAVDPHVWLSPRLFMEVSHHVAERFADLDPDSAAHFEANAGALHAELEALDQEMQAGLRRCERRSIVVSHEAFGYLTDEYDLEQVGIAGIDPESEPSPARLAEVKDFAEGHAVTTIFFEDLVSPALADTLAGELGIETDVLTPLESAPADGDYLTAMRSNLKALREALGCR